MTDRVRERKERKRNRDELWSWGHACSTEQPVSFNTSLYEDTTDRLTNHIKQKDLKEINLTIHGYNCTPGH